MKIAVIGAGAMGNVLGAHFSIGGAEVFFVDPFEAHVKAMQEHGLKFQLNQEEPRILSVNAVTSADQIHEKMDLILFMVKGLFTESAAKGAQCLADEHTYCMTLQNGIGNDEILARYFNPDRILIGIIDFGARMVEPGSVCALLGPAAIIEFASNTAEAPGAFEQSVAELLTRSGLKASAKSKSEIRSIIWYKLAKNCSSNPICAVTRLPLGPYNNTEEGMFLRTAVFKEVETVAAAQGITLAAEGTPKRIEKSSQMYFHLPSTAQDVKMKKQTEAGSLNGAVAALGDKLGIPTPYNHMLYALVRIVEQNYEEQF